MSCGCKNKNLADKTFAFVRFLNSDHEQIKVYQRVNDHNKSLDTIKSMGLSNYSIISTLTAEFVFVTDDSYVHKTFTLSSNKRYTIILNSSASIYSLVEDIVICPKKDELVYRLFNCSSSRQRGLEPYTATPYQTGNEILVTGMAYGFIHELCLDQDGKLTLVHFTKICLK